MTRPQTRLQHGGGVNVSGGDASELAGWKILREMVRHIWPRDQPSLKARVVFALGLLVGAKVWRPTVHQYVYIRKEANDCMFVCVHGCIRTYSTHAHISRLIHVYTLPLKMARIHFMRHVQLS